jgi:hypothetical protein
MQPRPDPRRRVIIAWNTPPAVATFDPAHHRATNALARRPYCYANPKINAPCQPDCPRATEDFGIIATKPPFL